MKKSIDDYFKCFDRDSDEKFSTAKKTIKVGFIGAGFGCAVGIAGGIFLGESINDYFEVLKQAPTAIQYGVDTIAAVICGEVGVSIGGTIALLPRMYKLFKKF